MPEMTGGKQPDAVLACVGGGSNAMGIFHPYIGHENTRLIGVEAAGEGIDSGKHSASLQRGTPGVLHGNRTYVLQNEETEELLGDLEQLFAHTLPRYEREDKAYLTIPIGCTGGRHRSVYLVEALAERFRAAGRAIQIRHSELA